MNEEQRNRTAVGAILILLGLAFLAMQIWEGLGGDLFLFLFGSVFVVGYLVTRNYGLLIPGGILLGIGLGAIGSDALVGLGDLAVIGLGLGFVFIYVVALIYQGRSHWWPLIPGGILIVVGLAQGSEIMEQLLSVGWPLVLIFFGLLLLAGAFGLIGRGGGGTDRPPQE
jgi:hypothetical protein